MRVPHWREWYVKKADDYHPSRLQRKEFDFILKHNQAVMDSENQRALYRAEQAARENIDLVRELYSYQDFVESIPEDLRAELIAGFEKQQSQLMLFKPSRTIAQSFHLMNCLSVSETNLYTIRKS